MLLEMLRHSFSIPSSHCTRFLGISKFDKLEICQSNNAGNMYGGCG